MPFKAEITFVAARPFRYSNDVFLRQGDEIPFGGAPNDDKLARTSLVRQEIRYYCRKSRCSKGYDSISELLSHERSHNE
ncbi:MAG: hypothetical protein GWN58_08140 [Anaerolineae bacterium]|nr:hypothetical protein [Anaerolineae bacterium]